MNAKELLASGVFTTGTGQVLKGVHLEKDCRGLPCTIHSPSDHHMRDFPLDWRSDKGIFERICPHGVGHPDPDGQYEEHLTIHGCDGCCTPPAEKTCPECRQVGFHKMDCGTGRKEIKE